MITKSDRTNSGGMENDGAHRRTEIDECVPIVVFQKVTLLLNTVTRAGDTAMHVSVPLIPEVAQTVRYHGHTRMMCWSAAAVTIFQ